MSYYRTPEHRRLRAELIRKWRPWEKSTGPKTSSGKAKVGQNAFKGAIWPGLRQLSQALKEQKRSLDHVTFGRLHG